MVYLFPLLAGLFYGVGGLINKKVANLLENATLSGLLFNVFSTVGAAFLLFEDVRTTGIIISALPSDWILLGISTVFTAFAFWGLFTSLRNLPVSEQILLSRASVLTYTIGGILLLNERVTGFKALGLILVLLGIIISSLRKGKFVLNKWALLQLASSICFGLSVIIDNVISKNFSTGAYVFIQVLTTSLALLLVAFLMKSIPFKEKLTKEYFIYALLAGLVSVLGFYFVIKSYSLGGYVSISGAIGQLKIPIAVFGGYFLFNERKDLLSKILGSLIVVAGLILLKL